METPPPLAASLGGESVFPISYQVFGGSEYNPDLKGEGTLTIRGEPSVFQFAGRKRGLFSRRRVESVFTAAEICNVEVAGRKVRFEGSSGKVPRAFIFFCRTAEEAATVAALLPRRLDEDFSARQDFHARIRQLGAGTHPLASVTNLIIAANVVVFLVMAGLLGAGWFDVTDLSPYIRYGANNGAATTDGEWWRLITSMFMHYGVLHLALNMWALFQSGQLLERLQGRAIYTVTYFASGIGGGLLTIYWHGDKLWSAGASGAIFGVFGALLGYMLREKQSLPKSVFQPMLKSTLVFAGYNLFYGMVHPGIDNAAHIGGLVTGIALGWVSALPLDPLARAKMSASRLKLAVAALALIVILGIATTPRFDYSMREKMDFGRALEGVGDKETALLARQNEVLQRWDRTADNADAVIVMIEKEMIPFYTDMGKKIDAVLLAPGRTTARQRDALAKFIRYRLEGYPHLLAGVRDRNQDELRSYQASEQKASEALAELKKSKP